MVCALSNPLSMNVSPAGKCTKSPTYFFLEKKKVKRGLTWSGLTVKISSQVLQEPLFIVQGFLDGGGGQARSLFCSFLTVTLTRDFTAF